MNPAMAELLGILDGTVCMSLLDLTKTIAPQPLNARGHIDFRTRAARQWFEQWDALMGAALDMIDAGLAEVLIPADGCNPDELGITDAGRRYLAEMRAL